jgi:hypothetical protein
MGILLSFLLKNIVEKYLKNEDLGFNRLQGIEYQYAFDIHCNSFVPFYFFSFILQYFFAPLIISDNMISVFISNGLFLIGIIYYGYVTLLGYYGKKKLKNYFH